MKKLVLLQHNNGAIRQATQAITFAGMTRFIWTDGNGSEGIDVVNSTGRSSFGAWRLL